MARKDKSALISGMGIAMSIVTKLVEKARQAGLTDADIHRLATPEGDATIDRFVEQMVHSPVVELHQSPESVTCVLAASHTKHMLVQGGEYASVSWEVEHYFQLQNLVTDVMVTLRLVWFEQPVGGVLAEEAIVTQGYQLAGFHELLAYIAAGHAHAGDSSIVAIAESARVYVQGTNCSQLCVPRVHISGTSRKLRAVGFNTLYSPGRKFLVVERIVPVGSSDS